MLKYIIRNEINIFTRILFYLTILLAEGSKNHVIVYTFLGLKREIFGRKYYAYGIIVRNANWRTFSSTTRLKRREMLKRLLCFHSGRCVSSFTNGAEPCRTAQLFQLFFRVHPAINLPSGRVGRCLYTFSHPLGIAQA